jgi:AcrR family transcriptional regulator
MSKREANRTERRARILAAARSMIEDDAFSMRALADRAGVSVVTAYSLFGSRQNIIAALYEEDLEHFAGQLNEMGADVIDRMFAAPALTERQFGANPAFNRAMFRAIYGSGDSALSEGFITPRIRAWEVLIAEAAAEGLLDADVNVNAMAKNIIHMLIGSIQDWVRDNITLPQMHAEVAYGLSLILIPVATKRAVPGLMARFAEHDAALRRIAAERDVPALATPAAP